MELCLTLDPNFDSDAVILPNSELTPFRFFHSFLSQDFLLLMHPFSDEHFTLKQGISDYLDVKKP